jgi:hypothetical protein
MTHISKKMGEDTLGESFRAVELRWAGGGDCRRGRHKEHTQRERERERASIGKKERRRRNGSHGGRIVMYKKASASLMPYYITRAPMMLTSFCPT